MPAVMDLEDTPLETGTALSAWLREQFADSQAQTGKLVPARIICIGPIDATYMGEGTSQTHKMSLSQVHGAKDWMQNLSFLASAAKLIIPEMRSMSPEEQRNLKGYYARIYRKV
jgi:hypothetical protein